MNRKMHFAIGWVFIFLPVIAFGQLPGYPAPRYPKIPDITSVEQLMPHARYLVSKPTDKSANLRPGYGIRGGERVLMTMYDTTDPMVVEALRRALIEKNCRVDVLVLPIPQAIKEGPVDGANEMRYAQAAHQARTSLFVGQGLTVMFAGQSGADTEALRAFVKARKYDRVIGPVDVSGRPKTEYLAVWMNLFTREILGSAASDFPEEVADLLDRKGWEIIRGAKSVRFTDPEGTDIRWTWFPEYWQVVEGTHPHVKSVGGGPINFPGGYIYGPGTSEDPLIPGHLMGVALGIVLPESDAAGVVVATSNHVGPFPRIEILFQKHEVTQINGGGEYGKLLRQYLETYKNAKYPLYPRPGAGFLVECSIATNPKAYRPYNVMEAATLKWLWIEERRRSGIVHWGIGSVLQENTDWGAQNNVPGDHFHLHQYFSTYEATLQDGRKTLIINKGHLTALDDPEVRRVAAKYGDPDELLREDWIPAIPGINTPGDYRKDYADDPARWVTQEHRKAFAEAIARFNQRGGYGDVYK
ncbi:MAG: hypothetical protein HYX73_05620 [Acidobacteria bacterium]|nr:hypothetical protein [Acidobacteriota bacterium]